jgi:hypothetical protein
VLELYLPSDFGCPDSIFLKIVDFMGIQIKKSCIPEYQRGKKVRPE